MRVLVCHQPTEGGVGRHISDLLEGLGAKGHELILCSPSVPSGVGYPVQHIRLDLKRAVAPRADAAALASFRRIVSDVRPDLIHAHSSKAGAIARLTRLTAPRVPVLYTPHGYAFAGHFSRRAERVAYRELERALAPLATRVACVCEAEARLARSIGPSGRVCVIYNGIDAAGEGRVDPRIAELARGGPVIGTVTQLRPGKGLETLISAVPLVLALHPDVTVAIVGDGPELEALELQARSLNVSGAVHFVGSVADPLDALRGFDVFVHPSWAEAFPYAVLEAMSLARPIVASAAGGVPEAIIDGHSGLLTTPGDPVGLAQALIELLDDRGRAIRLGAEALSRVSGLFTRERMTDGLSGLYAEVGRPSRLRPSAAVAR
jgi:glycosyltransferase involved in cell wall biosynthesis